MTPLPLPVPLREEVPYSGGVASCSPAPLINNHLYFSAHYQALHPLCGLETPSCCRGDNWPKLQL